MRLSQSSSPTAAEISLPCLWVRKDSSCAGQASVRKTQGSGEQGPAHWQVPNCTEQRSERRKCFSFFLIEKVSFASMTIQEITLKLK